MRKELDEKQLEQMLSTLKRLAPLSPYSLTLYRREKAVQGGEAPFASCGCLVENALCHRIAQQFFVKELDDFFREGTPAVCRYGGGFYGFVVPFSRGGEEFCLVGDGVRDRVIDLWQLAALSRLAGGELFAMFPQVEEVSTTTFEQVDEVAHQVARRIGKELLQSHPVTLDLPPPEPPDRRLLAVAQTQEQLESTNTLTETVALCCEAIVTHFRIAGLAIALKDATGVRYHVSGVYGVREDLGEIASDEVDAFIRDDKVKRSVLYDAHMRRVLPALQATLCVSFPLRSQGELLGFLAILDSELAQEELLLISLLAHSAASRMSHILREAEQCKATALSGRLMSLANTLLLLDNKDELYEAILDIASELIDATQGSIMLIDKNGESMRIVFTRGMTLNVAQSLPIRVGKGIAGRVALSGEPLLINDVETDLRVAMSNRQRFKTKSLICIPLKLKKKVIGVLNLSDKRSLAHFTEADLQILTSFANLATLMIERTLVLEESVRFEQLSVTDSLTGLYNRRYFKSRLEEELARSSRQGLNLTVLFIDLDFFKNYNDVCGHLAGDEALRKTADIIKASVREMDVVARYGGEEFCAVLPGTSKAEAMVVAERIRSEIEAERFAGESDIPFRRLTASLGVASFPEDGETFTALVHASDVALYRAKANGRNRIVAAQTPAEQLLVAPATPDAAGEIPVQAATLAKTLDFNSFLEASLRGSELSPN